MVNPTIALMVQRPMLIVHGWSDRADSFTPLAQCLARLLQRDVRVINLANYVSMDDAVTFTDLACALQFAWKAHALPMQPRSVDVVVHSTGALVVRDWMTRFFAPGSVPIFRLLMLAPANFGSPLAHKGRSMIGRVIKGFTNENMFHVGARLLEGLELASAYTWNLALRDRFASRPFFGPGGVLATSLVGATGYTGIAAAANTEASDGVVRCASANLNAALMHADFTDPHAPIYRIQHSIGHTAFSIIAEENHDSIALKSRSGFRSTRTAELIRSALEVTDESFDAWCDSLDTPAHGCQDTIFHVHDQHGEPVRDYFLEFYLDDDDTNWFAERFHRKAIRHVHVNRLDASRRSVLIDRDIMHTRIDQPWEAIKFSVTATPDLETNGNVGFRTFRNADIDGVRIPRNVLHEFVQPNRTLLVDVTLTREQHARLVTFQPAPLTSQPG